jgi:hypothetical protein
MDAAHGEILAGFEEAVDHRPSEWELGNRGFEKRLLAQRPADRSNSDALLFTRTISDMRGDGCYLTSEFLITLGPIDLGPPR